MKNSKVKLIFKDGNGDIVKTVTNIDYKNAKNVALRIVSRNDNIVTYYIKHYHTQDRKKHIEKHMYKIEFSDNDILVYKIDYNYRKFRENSHIFLNVNDIRVNFRKHRRNKTYEEQMKIKLMFE